MKVLFCQPTMQFSGSENSLYQLICTIKDDVEVSVLYAEEGPFLSKITSVVDNANIFYVESSKLKRNFNDVIKFIRSFRTTYRYFKSQNFKERYTYAVINTLMFPQAYIACGLLGIKAITICRENKITYGALPFFLYTTISLLSNYKIVVLFKKQISYFTLGFLFRKKFVVIPNTIASTKKIQATSRMQTGKIKLLSIIGLSVRKGVFDLFEIVKLLHQRFPDQFTLTIVGKKDEKIIEVFREKYSLEIQSLIDFAGEQSDTSHYFDIADLFIHPSHTEALPRVLLEAIYYGKPIVTTNVGGSNTIVWQDQNGFLFEVGNCLAAAESVGHLFTDKDRRDRFGSKSLKIFNENFAPDIIRKNFMEILR